MKREARYRGVGMVLLACSLTFAWAAHGGTFYVSPQGNDQNPGTIDQPWRTITKANVSLQPGDSVLVREGAYAEQIAPARDGVEGRPIVYSAMPGEHVVIEGLPGRLIVVIASDYSIIEGFTIRCQAYLNVLQTPEYWIHIVGEHITLSRCRVIADGDAAFNYGTLKAFSRGIVVAGHYNTVEHCYVRGQMMGVVIAGGLPRFTILRFDTLVNHGSSNIVILPHESSGEFNATFQGTLIEDCVIDTSWDEDNIQWEPNYLDHTQPYNNGTIIRRCRLGHSAENCLDLKGAGSVLIDNCYLYGSAGDNNGLFDGGDHSGGAGIHVGSGETSRYVIMRRSVLWDNHTGAHMYEGYRYYNNVFLNNRRSYLGSNDNHPGNNFFGVEIWNQPWLQRAFVNNIVYSQPNRAAMGWGMDYGGRFAINNNIYFDPAGPAKFSMELAQGLTLVSGIDRWKSELASYGGYAYLGGKDQQSMEEDPRFVNVPALPVDYNPSWDFRLSPGSPAIDAGRVVTNAVQSGTNSTLLRVDDARFFCDGFGVTDGDVIKIGAAQPVAIVSIDTASNTILIASPRTWPDGAGVHLEFEGDAPDIGAFEFSSGIGQVLLPPQPTTPANGALNLQLSFRLVWQRATGASSYYLQVANNSTFSDLLTNPEALTDTAYSLAGLKGNTTYYWRVRSGNSSGMSAWSAEFSFATAPTGVIPNVPTTDGPVSGATDVTTNPLLSWGSTPDAFTYGVQLSTGPSFGTTLLNRSGITGTSTSVDGLKNGTTYYWRVNATGSGGTSGWSAVATLTTFTVPDGLTGNTITNSDFNNGSEGWSFSTSGGAALTTTTPGYQSANAARITVAEAGTTAQLFQNGLILSPDSTYRLTFAARSTHGDDCDVTVFKTDPPYSVYGPSGELVDLRGVWKTFFLDFTPKNFSSPVNDVRLRFAFSRTATPGEAYDIDDVRLFSIDEHTPPPPSDGAPTDFFLDEIYPNPFNPATTIRYSIPVDVHVVIRVYNVLGQLVLTQVDGLQTAGTHDAKLDLGKFSSGMYLCTLQAGEYRQTRKLMYVK